jgi:hypothetical protein
MLGDRGMERAIALGRAERQVLIAVLRLGDAEDSSGNASILTHQLGSARCRDALHLGVANRRRVQPDRLVRCLRHGGKQKAGENEAEKHHFVGSILSELLKRLK